MRNFKLSCDMCKEEMLDSCWKSDGRKNVADRYHERFQKKFSLNGIAGESVLNFYNHPDLCEECYEKCFTHVFGTPNYIYREKKCDCFFCKFFCKRIKKETK